MGVVHYVDVSKVCLESPHFHLACFLFSIHYVKRPGAVLDAGNMIAKLTLDDPSKVQQAKLYEGKLPEPQNPSAMCGEKLHQIYQTSRTYLENILAGYVIPEPFFTKSMKETVDTMMKCLRDPLLPLLELQVGLYFVPPRTVWKTCSVSEYR